MRVVCNFQDQVSIFTSNSVSVEKAQRADTLMVIIQALYRKGWLMWQETTQDSQGSDILARVTMLAPK